MNYGLYIAASGMSANMARQDVLSNNLANVDTTGFKADLLAIRQRHAARVEDGLGRLPSNLLLERLGAGVQPTATRIDVSPAALEATNRPLDLGIDGEGFFVVRAGPGNEGLRLTRDGRLAISSQGQLVSSSSGRAVLDVNDQAISVNPALALEIRPDGRVVQAGGEVARLAVVNVPEADRLVKAGDGLLAGEGSVLSARTPARGSVRQGFLEGSSVNPISAMIAVTGATRAVESNATVIGYINESLGRAIGTLGRVS